MFAIAAGLDVTRQELGFGGNLAQVSGESVPGEAVDVNGGRLIDAHVGEAGFRDIDLDPELQGFEEGEDDAPGGDEVSGAKADDLDHGVGGSEQDGFFQARIEFGDAALGLGEPAARGVDVFFAKAFAREYSRGLGLRGASLRGAQIFRPGAGLKQRQALARGLGALFGGIAFFARVVELLTRDGIGGHEFLHALEEGFSVDGVSLRGCEIGLRLGNFFSPRPVLRGFEGRLLGRGGGFGFGNFFGPVAALHTIEIGLGLYKLGGGLGALRFQLIAFKAHQHGADLDLLAFFNEHIADTAADF